MMALTLSNKVQNFTGREIVLKAESVSVSYGNFLAVSSVSLEIPQNQIVAFIGPSGCGKSTMLRCFNRMNDLLPGAKVEGKIAFYGVDLYDQKVDAVSVRRCIGMVFQQPNPFPQSIYKNIAYAARVNGYQGDMDELVKGTLRQAFLWDEVKDKLKKSALSLSGGQQQRLCIARALAIEPAVLLMDEPCSALDPISTRKIEELLFQLKQNYTIIIVTHNIQQASRISDWTAFFNVKTTAKGEKTGYLVEFEGTESIFGTPQQEATRDYVNGRFG